MANRCQHCTKPFGLVRRGTDLTLATFKLRVWDSLFCSEKCEQDYRKERQQEVRVLQFLQWLHNRAPPSTV